jgi:PAS domain S-box-containing protein
MENESNLKGHSDFADEVINLIIDKSGRIIAHGPEFSRLVPSALPNSDFFELFDSDKKVILHRIFLDSKRSENISSDILELMYEGQSLKFQTSFFPLRSENNVYFLVSFCRSEKMRFTSQIRKFWFAAADIEKLVDDIKLVSIFNKIKLTYPFTFIEKAKIQKEINELNQHFWIKDISGKYLIVNEKFANAFGSKPNQVENKYENDFIPKYLTSLYKTIDQYVLESSNTVIVEGISIPILGGVEKDISLVEFPLSDLDNKVIAIIGFSKKSGEVISSKSSLSPELFLKLPLPILFVDKINHIASYSNELIHFLELDRNINYTGSDLNNVFEKGLVALFENYLKNPDSPRDFIGNYTFTEKVKHNTEVRFIKYVDKSGDYLGTQISFNLKFKEDAEVSVKAKMYDGLIGQLSDAMFVYDIENLKFLEVNDAALKLYGYKRNDFLNMDLTDLYAPEDIQTLISSGDSKSVISGYSGPWRHKKSDGSSILVEINRSSIEFLGKKAHLNIVKDVSSQTESKKHQQILESTYENTSEAILITDKDGFITEINEPVSRRLGYARRDLETRPFVSLVGDEDRAKVNKIIFHSGILKTTSLDIELKKPSGTLHKATVIATPIKNYNGDVENFSLIVKLVEEPISEKDLKNTENSSIQKIDAPFLSNVFHEILTPINVILGFTQELGESIPSPNDEQKEAIDIIQENQKLLLQIMDNAVEYSTLEQKVIKLRPEEIKFVDLLNEIRENTRKSAESKKVEVAYGKISSSLTLETDKQRIISLLTLFIKFAIQITKENTIYLSANVYNNNYCSVGIKDGKNMITPFLLKAFTDIFAEDETMSRRNYGFSRFSVKLAKKLVELLSVNKEPILKSGEPVEFALIFPMKFQILENQKMEVDTVIPVKSPKSKLPPKPDIPAVIEKEIKSQPKVEAASKLDLSQLSCLYLEDQVDSQMLFKVQMKDLKSIEFAISFESALPLLKTRKFDFIVMDINLQGEYNGLDALRIIQQMPGYKNIPIIASTAYIQPGARESFIAAGFSEFVSKPLLRDKLIEVLKNFF